MILDSLDNSEKYESLHPAFREAFEYIKATDFSKLKPGWIQLRGEDLFVNYDEMICRQAENSKIETHKQYIDIQIPLSDPETMGWMSAGRLKKPVSDYDGQRDIAFFHDFPECMLRVMPGEFVIFFPEDAHMPGLGFGVLRKLVVKVRI